MKKYIGIILSFILIMHTFGITSVEASSISFISDEIRIAINNELAELEGGKYYLGMQNVDFEKLHIGTIIPIYEYKNTGFEKFSNAYVLYENNHPVTLLFELAFLEFQAMPSLLYDLEQLDCKNYAIIYDSVGCYVYDGIQLHYLGNGRYSVDSRDEITFLKEEEISKLELSTKCVQYLNYSSPNQNSRATRSYACNINYVSQGSYDKICWAACIAMITNYLNVTSLTAVDVARAKFPTGTFNKYIQPNEAVSLLRTYNVNYTYINRKPTVNEIMLNLDDGYPIYGIFSKNTTTESVHATVIYWMSATGMRIMLMDPMYGSIEARYNSVVGVNTYQYTDPYTGSNILCTLNAAVCKVISND